MKYFTVKKIAFVIVILFLLIGGVYYGLLLNRGEQLVSQTSPAIPTAEELVQLEDEVARLRSTLAHLNGSELSKLPVTNLAEKQAQGSSSEVQYQLLATEQASLTREIAGLAKRRQERGEFVNPLWLKSDAELIKMVKEMSVEAKAGQLLMFAVKGQVANPSYLAELKLQQPGGMIVMGSNVAGKDQLANLIRTVQSTNSAIPLLIAIDQEGGVVKRLNWDTTASQKQWVSLGTIEVCSQAKLRAELLRQVGVNLNFSPVVDLAAPGGGFINNRTISQDPAVVSELAKAYVDCHQGSGVLATLKHYPGHGATSADSHFTLPVITKDKASWLATDARPFKEINSAGLLMVGHLHYNKLDPSQPASQSEVLVDQVLRQELGFKGVVITDDMGQLHTSTKISSSEAMANSLNAGIDIILYVNPPKSEAAIIAELTSLIAEQKVAPVKVDASLIRILQLKRQLY